MESDNAFVEPKPGFQSYRAWLSKTFAVSDLTTSESYYRTVTDTLKAQFSTSSLVRALEESLPEFRDQYRSLHKSDLFSIDPIIRLNVKPYRSFLLKSYRRNVLNNDRWPEEPSRKWSNPTNWFTETRDILRCELVGKYLDGAVFIAESLKTLFDNSKRYCEVEYEARETGYYAIHVVTDEEYEIPDPALNYAKCRVRFEIQITTQLQEVMRSLTHSQYEQSRERPMPTLQRAGSWQWNYKAPEFSMNYIGHMLRYIEGAIMELRERNAD